MSKLCQKVVNKLSKSCQKVIKKLSKCCHKSLFHFIKGLEDERSRGKTIVKIRYNFENTNDKEGKNDLNSKRAGRKKEEEEEIKLGIILKIRTTKKEKPI
jgi:CRISPR/Cas system CSM-associated protein Csm4 (group 5 of RAMP superfamily)